jgi:NTE family protein
MVALVLPRSVVPIGLVLSGGGARGAYQAGVARAIAEIAAAAGVQVPFRAIAGVSAGAINAAYLGAFAHDLLNGARNLCDLWSGLTPERVYETSALSLGRIGARWARTLSLSPIVGGAPATSLLDTSPLRRLLSQTLPFASLHRNVAQGVLSGVALTATDYATTHTVTFYESAGRIPPWKRRRRLSQEVALGVEHVMASSAIPIFFEPVAVNGAFYGDGCLRNTAPLSPAIHLGADRLIVVGVRRRPGTLDDSPGPVRPTLARILGVLLNAVFFDAVDFDVERLTSINRMLEVTGMVPAGSPVKPIEILTIQPSEDLGLIARDEVAHLPRVLRYLLRGMGTAEEASEVISYLSFEATYTTRLIEVGHRDAMDVRGQIEAFLGA